MATTVATTAGGSTLSGDELSRYSRHILLPELGLAGQQRLKSARVLIIGAGGLGSPTALYLAAAGVGTLGIIDNDHVEDSNLQRQVIYTIDDLSRAKAECAAQRLAKLNPHIQVKPYELALTAENALDIIADYDLVIDGSDNFATRYLSNDACVLLDKPNIYGSIFRFEGQSSVFHHAGGPCYRCLFPEPPDPSMAPSCAEAGVLGVLPAVIAGIQATEAIKVLTGIGETLSGRLLQYDALTMTFRALRIARDPQCPVCGDNPSITRLEDYQHACNNEANRATSSDEMTPEQLQQRLQQGEELVLIDVREPYERDICTIAGSISMPLPQLTEQMDKLDHQQTLVCYCKSGGRSAQACELFRSAGFSNVFNLTGGILAWAQAIEPAMRRY